MDGWMDICAKTFELQLCTEEKKAKVFYLVLSDKTRSRLVNWRNGPYAVRTD